MDNKQVLTISYGQCVHSIPFASLPTYDKVLSIAKNLFKNIDDQHLNLYYVDDEGDHVAAKSDMELNEVYRLAEVQHKREVRLYVGKVEEVHSPSAYSDEPYKSFPIPDSIPIEVGIHYNNHNAINTNYLQSNEDLDILAQIQRKLNEMTTVVGGLTQTRKDQIEKMVQASEYQRQISELENKCNNLDQLKKMLDREIAESLKHNERIKSTLQEKEEQLKKRLAEIEILKEDLLTKTKQTATYRETAAKMGIQLQNKVKEVQELKKENDNKMILESKLELLQKEIDQKNGENLQMSKIINDVLAQKEGLQRKAVNLEHQLESEHQEKENLQHSIIQLQQSKRLDFFPDIKNGYATFDPVISDVKSISINPADLPLEGRPYQVELEELESMGYKDRAKNIELLNQYQDVSKVVNHYQKGLSTVIPKSLPEDISEVDIQMLEAMGFYDLDANIAHLRKYKDIGAVINSLLG